MNRYPQNDIPSLLERYELKYQIPVSMVEPICDFISPYCSPDKYAENSEDGFYNIYSLYLDTPNFLFLNRKLQGSPNRFNMRIRTYTPHTGLPCFFEVKHKIDRVVRKYRARVVSPHWALSFENSTHCLKNREIPEQTAETGLFTRLLHSYQAAPKVLTCYRRKAFISDVDDYARVTFDVDLCCQPEERFNLVPDENQMTFYDTETVFDPGCAVILELKCYTTQIPLWMIELIRRFDLFQSSFSKYANSSIRVFEMGRTI